MSLLERDFQMSPEPTDWADLQGHGGTDESCEPDMQIKCTTPARSPDEAQL